MYTVKQWLPLSHRSAFICWSQELSFPNWDACMNIVLTSADISRLKCITLGNSRCQGTKRLKAFQGSKVGNLLSINHPSGERAGSIPLNDRSVDYFRKEISKSMLPYWHICIIVSHAHFRKIKNMIKLNFLTFGVCITHIITLSSFLLDMTL